MSRATRLSTFPDSGLKQGWSGFRVFPSSGMQVCNHVSKKGVSLEGLGSERITWTDKEEDVNDSDMRMSEKEERFVMAGQGYELCNNVMQLYQIVTSHLLKHLYNNYVCVETDL